MGRLDGKNVFITGAGSGFGQRTAELFAQEGAKNVYIVDRLAERLEKTASLVVAAGGNPVPICCDLGVMANCTGAIETALGHDPKLDVMISNAAAWANEHFLDMTEASWRRVMSVDLDAYFMLANRAARAMKDTGGGSILFTSSISSLGHGRGWTSYAVAKAALISLAKAIAVECAQWNIRANCVSPGPGDTQQSVDITSEELMAKWRKEGFPVVPLNRLASTDDIAHAFLYLASDEARYVSGINLIVDGALTAQAYDVPEK
ncbi:MAG: SDR family oxidoreductase [Acidobacteria bacterium]|nr:SDR family oxidoreductase [Acidobacteriota bacterium]